MVPSLSELYFLTCEMSVVVATFSFLWLNTWQNNLKEGKLPFGSRFQRVSSKDLTLFLREEHRGGRQLWWSRASYSWQTENRDSNWPGWDKPPGPHPQGLLPPTPSVSKTTQKNTNILYERIEHMDLFGTVPDQLWCLLSQTQTSRVSAARCLQTHSAKSANRGDRYRYLRSQFPALSLFGFSY